MEDHPGERVPGGTAQQQQAVSGGVQAGPLAFQKQGKGRVLVTLRMNDTTQTASIDKEELIGALREHGSTFFLKLSRLLPGNSNGYADAVLADNGSMQVIWGMRLRSSCRLRDDRRLCVCGLCSFWLFVCLRG
jgi:hypothetical protein